MDPLKGFDELIRATALLRERGVPAQLKLAGHSNAKSPDHASDLRKLIDDLDLGDSVTLLGAAPFARRALRGSARGRARQSTASPQPGKCRR